ncbi:hypothetical protein [uncultured Roseovarius sp.]|uniref:hypothetical protein n=1 Tax=uncultured Roseovarius sp. TaxID=293344 RepID=UPI0025915157|nr:hypothetical protein [uncultured Roseovarius sp.]
MGNSAKTTESADAKQSGDPRVPAGGETPAVRKRLQFEILRSAFYHDMRQTTLMRIHQFALFFTVVLGSGAIAALGTAFPMFGQMAGAAVAAIGAGQLVWDFGGSARDHGDLRRRFYSLLAEAESDGDVPDIYRRMTLIYADEPPVKLRVNKKAHNRAGDTIYGEGEFHRA